MSGWGAYVETQLVATGAVSEAGIFGKEDAALYANAGDFQLRQYSAEITQEDGSTKTEPVNEVANLLSYVKSGQTPPQGMRLNGTKFQMLRTLEGPTLYLKKNKGGACLAITNTLVIVGVYDDEKNSASSLAACNTAVENLADYLRQSGY
ncbi:unnamed protein product [Chrysoparadoxa australica]